MSENEKMNDHEEPINPALIQRDISGWLEDKAEARNEEDKKAMWVVTADMLQTIKNIREFAALGAQYAGDPPAYQHELNKFDAFLANIRDAIEGGQLDVREAGKVRYQVIWDGIESFVMAETALEAFQSSFTNPDMGVWYVDTMAGAMANSNTGQVVSFSIEPAEK